MFLDVCGKRSEERVWLKQMEERGRAKNSKTNIKQQTTINSKQARQQTNNKQTTTTYNTQKQIPQT